MLTQVQATTMRVIIDYQAAHGGASPSYTEISCAIGIKHRSGVKRMLDELERRVFIQRVPYRNRGIEVLRHPPTEDTIVTAARRLLASIVSENPEAGIATVSSDALGDLDVAIGELDAASSSRAA